jgi:hypothetical protein
MHVSREFTGIPFVVVVVVVVAAAISVIIERLSSPTTQ